MSLEIRAVALAEEELFAQWHATYLVANEHEVGCFHTCWTLPELCVSMEPTSRRWSTGHVGLEDTLVPREALDHRFSLVE